MMLTPNELLSREPPISDVRPTQRAVPPAGTPKTEIQKLVREKVVKVRENLI